MFLKIVSPTVICNAKLYLYVHVLQCSWSQCDPKNLWMCTFLRICPASLPILLSRDTLLIETFDKMEKNFRNLKVVVLWLSYQTQNTWFAFTQLILTANLRMHNNDIFRALGHRKIGSSGKWPWRHPQEPLLSRSRRRAGTLENWVEILCQVRSFWGWSLVEILKFKILWLEFDQDFETEIWSWKLMLAKTVSLVKRTLSLGPLQQLNKWPCQPLAYWF